MGVEEDIAKAKEWFGKAAEQGDAVAQCELKMIKIFYLDVKETDEVRGDDEELYDLGIDEDDEAEGGDDEEDDEAQFKQRIINVFREDEEATAEMYDNDEEQYDLDNVDVDKETYKVIAEKFRRSAEQGDPEAQYYLGCCYAYGYSIEKDMKKAVMWIKESARQ